LIDTDIDVNIIAIKMQKIQSIRFMLDVRYDIELPICLRFQTTFDTNI